MTEKAIILQEALEIFAAEERDRLGEKPTDEELLQMASGHLEGAKEGRVLDYLAVDKNLTDRYQAIVRGLGPASSPAPPAATDQDQRKEALCLQAIEILSRELGYNSQTLEGRVWALCDLVEALVSYEVEMLGDSRLEDVLDALAAVSEAAGWHEDGGAKP